MTSATFQNEIESAILSPPQVLRSNLRRRLVFNQRRMLAMQMLFALTPSPKSKFR